MHSNWFVAEIIVDIKTKFFPCLYRLHSETADEFQKICNDLNRTLI